MRTENFIDLTADLRALGGQRVWSLMISLFGDLAQDAGQSIDGPLLSAMMTLMQVKPEAVRVALHRLRNDGWLTSAKSGRISRHSLTDKGRAESVAASPRIYAAPDLSPEGWQLVLTDDSDGHHEALLERGFTMLVPRVYIGPRAATSPDGTLCLPADTAPGWLRRELEPDAQADAHRRLSAALARLHEHLPDPTNLTPVETAVLRCLIVHNWRRLVLRVPALPPALVDPDGPARQCHVQVSDLLTRLKRPQLADLAQFRAAA